MADTLPAVFDEDALARQTRVQERLSTNLGRTLAPGDVETLIGNAIAYETTLQAIAGNEAFRKNLVRYATGFMLDLLGELLGVTRLPATGASCTIEFTLVNGHNAVQIPAGLRMQSIDGKVIFQTTEAKDVAIGVNTVQVTAVCSTAGAIGNGYDAGKISIILDPQPFVTTAQNIDTTTGGVDAESDDQFRERIKLAPASFSVAGPKGAYEFFAKSAHPSIVDVNCVTTNPGEVTLYILCDGGTLASSEIKDAVLAICSDEKVRPQNDTVLVDDPTVINYSINIQLTTYNGAINSDVLAQVNAALTDFKNERVNQLGKDVVKAQLSALCMIKDQVYNANVVSPVADIPADENEYTKCTGITVTIIGSTDG